MKNTVIPIRGMHCRSCELLIEDELSHISGVCKVEVSEKKASARIYYESHDLSLGQVQEAVERAGYEVGFNEKKPWFSPNLGDYTDIFYAGVALFFLYPRLPTVKIVGTDLAHAIPLTALAGLGHWTMGNVNFVLLGSLLVGSLPGIWLGSHLSAKIPDKILRPALASVLLLIGFKFVLQ